MPITERCFTSAHLDEITQPRLRRYMKHELFIMFGISILYARLNNTEETDAAVDRMWDTCQDFDPKWGRYFRRNTSLRIICTPGRVERNISGLVYRVANKVVRFN